MMRVQTEWKTENLRIKLKYLCQIWITNSFQDALQVKSKLRIISECLFVLKYRWKWFYLCKSSKHFHGK